MWPKQWHEAIGRSLLDLPVEASPYRSVLDLWCDQATDLASRLGMEHLSVHVCIDRTSPAPVVHRVDERLEVYIQRDELEWRGSGGVLHDVAVDYADEAPIVAVHAAQIPLEPLHTSVRALADTSADLAMAIHPNGPCGSLMWLRCRCLRRVPRIGFCDFNEQALPTIAQHFTTRALPRSVPLGLSIRTCADYLSALRLYHRQQTLGRMNGPFNEDGQPAFSIVEPGASVHPTAQVLDSVVLRGSQVGQGSLLVRCVVCPGAVVPPGSLIVDQLVLPST